VVTNAKGDKQEFLVEMRKQGTFYLGRGPPKTKPDVTITVSDKDMVNLSTGKLNVSRIAKLKSNIFVGAASPLIPDAAPVSPLQPQMAFMKGKIKVKGNLMLGLRW